MASLNTLRTKFGYVLSAIIALALLAFIFSMKSEMGFSNNDPVVGVIDSEDVLYTEYLAEYQKVKDQSGMTESSEQEASQLASAAWQSLIASKLLVPGFETLGLSVSESERMGVINGVVPTQTFGAAFTDPSTGIYSSSAISGFLSQAAVNPEAEAAWATLNSQARDERLATKFSALARSGAYVNKLEVAQGVASSNNTFSGRVVAVPYSSLSDSLFSVSNAEVKKYYEANKSVYKKLPTRSLRYALFAFEPTEEDIVNIENTALATSKEFEAADDLRAFVRANLNGSIANNYVPASVLDATEAAQLSAGKMYGPVNQGNTWKMTRAASSITAPDTLGIRHIVLRYDQTDLADSLYAAIKGGADFAMAALQNSLYTQTAQMGGEIGLMPFSAFTDEFIAALAPASKGDIIRVDVGDMIQIIEVYSATRPKTHYQLATVEYPVEASQATIGALHSAAGMFSTGAKGSVENFNKSAGDSGIVVRNATITNGDRVIRMVDDSREIARWAYGAQVGEISEIFKTDAGYVVAMLTEVDDNEYRPMESVASTIRPTLIRQKKFEQIAKGLNGSSLDAIAQSAGVEPSEFADVKFSSQYIQGVGVEPKVVGAITLGSAGLSAPIEGLTSVYVVDVNPVVSTQSQDAEMERVRAQATAEDRAAQYIFTAIQEMANVKDLRGKFF